VIVFGVSLLHPNDLIACGDEDPDEAVVDLLE
jgi:hypothetical protein